MRASAEAVDVNAMCMLRCKKSSRAWEEGRLRVGRRRLYALLG